ncbi:Uncharacterized protein Fot_35252 [Forsythia ovata]|uniref:Agenet-like domain-containing protein n=1 Tax=Forsythia ovata TaxID=205694 RepID=A0ABD1SMG3_9LAMI
MISLCINHQVSLEDDGFQGSWYTATVVRPISKKTHKIHLEFHTLTSGDNSAKLLREAVDPIMVRSIQPRGARRQFNVSDDVDAFHNEGWWEGILLPSTVVATLSSSGVLVSRLNLTNPNSASIVSGSMASGQKCGIFVCHFQSRFFGEL